VGVDASRINRLEYAWHTLLRFSLSRISIQGKRYHEESKVLCFSDIHIFGSSGKRVPARRERTSSVCCELALWGDFEFLALKGLHRVAQGI
jgi:hypothetical protein